MRPLTTCWTSSASMRETTAGARSGARREWCREEGHRLLGGRQLPQLRAWRDGDDGVLAVLDLRHDDVAVALPVLVELVEAVEAPGLERLERRHDLGRRRLLGRLDGLGHHVDRVEATHALDHADPRKAALLPLVNVGLARFGVAGHGVRSEERRVG